MYTQKYRMTFYSIPYMRGGVDVPISAAPAGDIRLDLEKYFISEIISDKQFSETQNQIVITDASGISLANYMRIARTTASEPQQNYNLDKDEAFFWVDDIQITGATRNSDGQPAAIVTIAPDPWLTDFCDASAKEKIRIRGRLKQSTKEQAGERISPPVEPVTDFSKLNFADVSGTSGADALFDVVGVFTEATGGLIICASKTGKKRIEEDVSNPNITDYVYYFSKVAFWRYSAQPKEGNIAANCVKLLVVPNSWIEWSKQGTDITLTTDSDRELDAVRISIKSGFGLKLVESITAPTSFSPKFNYFMITPTRVIRLENTPYVLDPAYTSIANIYVGVPYGFSSDNIAIFLEVEGEILDITDDFQADFAINDQALKQAQQKENTTLSVMTGVIGGVGGIVGGVSSGNYFGAIQSALGGASALMAPTLARKTPAAQRGSGNVITAIYGQGILAIASTYQLTNETQYDAALSRFGYIYPNKPYVELEGFNSARGNFFSFEEVDVSGITGGQASAAEIAADLIRGVNLKEL